MSEDNGSIGFFGVLTLILITLKLLGLIEISWWIVLCPLWIPFILFLIFVLVIIISELW